jgi:predicted nucleotidyltransferase
MGYLALLKQRESQRMDLRKEAFKEAERLSSLLRKKFEYETLYLFGSVVKGRGFRRHSDIDLVIKGLKTDSFFKAFAFLIQNSPFPIDLKPWEELDAESKARVAEEGRILQ